ncbi:CopZ family metallochaperone [Deinococcus yavapaiensis]|uniref:Copper chaperone CopZ n=1 Tax=Deinococcus yavapaiensis KR-236 TaxID=694435 RepID=A0A318S459_9DEIO|nr:heavy metal-associated domain-containing protein [Deinococcus yavapaiensis]PYE49932.1 copper chaperone CopZ [Deinococcus yavapaiensis KR-236]
MSRIELQVSGMSCGHCQAGVTKALKSVPGVTDAQVDLTSGKAVVQGDVEPRLLVEAIVEEGYEATIASA